MFHTTANLGPNYKATKTPHKRRGELTKDIITPKTKVVRFLNGSRVEFGKVDNKARGVTGIYFSAPPPKTKAVGVRASQEDGAGVKHQKYKPSPTAPQAKDWKERFDKRFGFIPTSRNESTAIVPTSENLKDFIHSLLHSNREEVIKELRNVVVKHGVILLDGKMYSLEPIKEIKVVNTGEVFKLQGEQK